MKSFIELLSLMVLVCSIGVLQAEDPAPAVQTEAAQVQEAAPPTLNLGVEVKLGTGVEQLEIVGEAAAFDETVEKVVGWTRVTGAAEPTEITHVWSYKGQEISTIPLAVKSTSYRTYSRKTVSGMPGSWKLEVKDINGAVLATKDFEVTAASKEPVAPAVQSEPAAPVAPAQ